MYLTLFYTALHSFNKISHLTKSPPLRPVSGPKDEISPQLPSYGRFTQFSPSHRLKNRSVHPLSRTPISRDISFAHRPQYPCSTYNLHHHHVFQSSPRLPTINMPPNFRHVPIGNTSYYSPNTPVPKSMSIQCRGVRLDKFCSVYGEEERK